MKRAVAVMLIVAMTMICSGNAMAAQKGRGGFMGFLVGCCLGVRSAAAYNDGKEISWREWCTLVPGFCIWNGVDGSMGVTTATYAERYGSQFF